MRSKELPGLPDHRAVYRTAQPTVQSVRLGDGVIHPQHKAFRTHTDGLLALNAHGMPQWWDRQGDGTVYRDATSSGAGKPTPMALQHAPPAKDDHTLEYVFGVLTERTAYRPAHGAGPARPRSSGHRRHRRQAVAAAAHQT
ncbi:hypothetical protein [Streptomyces sp. NRRL B-24484]|uniref:hypothetical protein n=1 Tax=Streptomyces sp. NRRL B-24484 TaxID=1463833 RepID=UPI0013315854|nr:hypothetical protein [Streptomyces sp. NRRL B-24484]